jgi:midasin (ATPase involved in ribosome maturation)
MNDLLKEAIADAKAVRETAMANAKLALEEAFTPRLQSMLSAKLAEEDAMEDEPVAEEEMEVTEEELESSEIGDDIDLYEDDMEPEAVEEEEEYMDEDEDLDLEEIIRELEGEMDSEEEPVAEEDEMEDDEPVTEEDEMEDEPTIEEIIRALREEDEPAEEEPVAEEEETEKELEEAYRVIRFLKSKINEVNLLNAKLLFSNKLFRNYSLNETQKVKVIENFDRAHTLREVKLVYSTLAESFTTTKSTRRLKESYASKSTPSTKPSRRVINEGSDLAARWKKLANI